MDKIVLKVHPEHYQYDVSEIPQINDLIVKAIKENEYDEGSWWYLHGQLETRVGFDKGFAYNIREAKVGSKIINWTQISGNKVIEIGRKHFRSQMDFDGEIAVKVDGIDEPCIGFFWTEDRRTLTWKGNSYPYWKQRGLVCLVSDKEACENARSKMLRKALCI